MGDPTFQPKYLSRKMSSSSLGMSLGPFPDKLGYPLPMINACLMIVEQPIRRRILDGMSILMNEFGHFSCIPEGKKWKEANSTPESHLHEFTYHSEKECFDHIEAIKSSPIRLDIPWWEIHVLTNTSNKEQKIAHQPRGRHIIVFRIHHCLGDGISLMEAISKFCTNSQDGPLQERIFPRPPLPPSGFLGGLKTAAAVLSNGPSIASWASGPHDSDLSFNVPLDQKKIDKGIKYTRRSVCRFPTVRLDYIKAIKNKVKCSVNDVLLAAFCGVLRAHAIEAGFELDDPRDEYLNVGAAMGKESNNEGSPNNLVSTEAGSPFGVCCSPPNNQVSPNDSNEGNEIIVVDNNEKARFGKGNGPNFLEAKSPSPAHSKPPSYGIPIENSTSSPKLPIAKRRSSTSLEPHLPIHLPVSLQQVDAHRAQLHKSGCCCCDGDKFPVHQSRVLMPVAFPRSNEELEDREAALGNRWAFVSVKLPIDYKYALHRLKKTVQIMNETKTSGVMLAALKITDTGSSIMSQSQYQKTAMELMERHSVVFSNVPGPDFEIKTFGSKLDEIFMIYPNAITQTGILSYNGRISFCVTLDPTTFKNADLLGPLFVKELIQLGREAGLTVCEDDVYFFD